MNDDMKNHFEPEDFLVIVFTVMTPVLVPLFFLIRYVFSPLTRVLHDCIQWWGNNIIGPIYDRVMPDEPEAQNEKPL